MDIWDRKAWRMASPHWTDRRERLIERKLQDAEAKGDGLGGGRGAMVLLVATEGDTAVEG